MKNMINLIDKYISDYSVEYHEKQTLKDYCVSRIEPSISNSFNRGDIISIKLRTSVKKIKDSFLEKEKINDLLKVIYTEDKEFTNKRIISQLYSITPAIFQGKEEDFNGKTFNNYVLGDRENVDVLKSAILRNAKAKSKLDKSHDFIKKITIRNKYPIKITNLRQKNKFVYLGDKLEIEIKEDAISQRIAQNLIINGIGKMCTSGSGFLNYKLK
ncbi:hypothetical protein [Psychrilyobacter sp.]|uniref:hypothetical protein n=1 Tax=Psychrilyobacter sp. TaxID=2586924 RepID=UPI00301B021A